MAYSNATFFIDLEGGNDAARPALTGVIASNPSGTVTRMTKAGHGLVTGAVVVTSLFTYWLNSSWKITVVDADSFDLDGAVWQATADTDGTVTPRGGSSKADAWKTIHLGATSTRHQGGDTIRLMASPDETLVGNATWTNYSKTVTLAAAVNTDIADCETAWTASANVTATADSVTYKEGTKSAKLVIAAGFTTGKVAYYPTGTLDLSGHQQVSFWVRSLSALDAGAFSLRLCTDSVGDSTAHTIPFPAIANVNRWTPVTVDIGADMGAAIASVAIYQDIDRAAVTVQLDNIVACKASASADALTLSSLVGKEHNLVWSASTVFPADTIRKPTQPNRTGFRYKVTAGGGGTSGAVEPVWPVEVGEAVVDGSLLWECDDTEETWYAIQSIRGATINLDNGPDTRGDSGRGYSGATETVATYKREPISMDPATQMVTQNNGTGTSWITYIGGWDRTAMSVQSGETWVSGQNGGSGSSMFVVSERYVQMSNINSVRCGHGIQVGASPVYLVNCHHNNQLGNGIYTIGLYGAIRSLGCVGNNSSGSGVNGAYYGHWHQAACLTTNNNNDYGTRGGYTYYAFRYSVKVGRSKNNRLNGYLSSYPGFPFEGSDIVTSNNAGGAFSYGSVRLTNSSIEEGVPAPGSVCDAYSRSTNDGKVAGNHLSITEGGSIVSATDQRHTAAGISWKFRPTSTARDSLYPLRLPVAKVACTAGAAVSVRIWTRRDSANIKGRLSLPGGQVYGIPLDIGVACEPTVGAWEQSEVLTFTPTTSVVVELEFLVWDGVGVANSFWVDDLEIT